MVNKGMELDVTIDKVRFPNLGLVEGYDKEIRIKKALKGSKGTIRITRKKENYYEGKFVEIKEKSPLETIEPCRHFTSCNGCTYQTLSYEDELRYKEEQVKSLFRDQAIDIDFEPIIASPSAYYYRNKMDYTFGDEYKDGPLALGMHKESRYYEIETVSSCNIAQKDFNLILDYALGYFRSTDLDFYHSRRHKGHLRNLVVRKGLTTGDILINLVTTSQKPIELGEFLAGLLELQLEGKLVGLVHTINDNVADIIKPDNVSLIYGQDYIIEEICGLKFKISPFSFFQTNTYAAERLYELVLDYLGDFKGKDIFDLFSGTGTIAQIMAGLGQKVTAVEIVEEAVEMARANASLNGLENIDFLCGDVFKVVDQIDSKPDLIVLDPPRPGLENSLEKILDFKASTYLYVSCNPVTMARDLKGFLDRGYKITRAGLIDQFPRTPHCEVICKLVRS